MEGVQPKLNSNPNSPLNLTLVKLLQTLYIYVFCNIVTKPATQSQFKQQMQCWFPFPPHEGERIHGFCQTKALLLN